MPPLDQKLAPVQLGRFTVFYGSPYSITLSFLLSVRSQLPPEEGGFDSPAIFIDGGNTFNPYQVSFLARKQDLDPQTTLQQIFISRAFTAYQLTQLLFQRVNQALEDYRAKLVVISDITTLYLDRDMPKTEAQVVFNKLTQHLTQLASEKNLAVLATHIPHHPTKLSIFLQAALHGRADTLLKLEEDNRILRLMLERHPNLKPRTVQLPLNSLGNSVTLEDFMEEA